MLLRQKAFRGKHKIKDRWENTVYIIKRKFQEIPVYEIVPRESSNDPSIVPKTVHRNLLFPLLTRQAEDVLQREAVEALDFESDDNSADEEEYTGPITRARAKKEKDSQTVKIASAMLKFIFPPLPENRSDDQIESMNILGYTRDHWPAMLVDRLNDWVDRLNRN